MLSVSTGGSSSTFLNGEGNFTTPSNHIGSNNIDINNFRILNVANAQTNTDALNMGSGMNLIAQCNNWINPGNIQTNKLALPKTGGNTFLNDEGLWTASGTSTSTSVFNNQFTVAVNANYNQINNLSNGALDSDAINVGQVKNFISQLTLSNLHTNGDNINVNGFKITNTADPTYTTDVATKNYVDTQLLTVGDKSGGYLTNDFYNSRIGVGAPILTPELLSLTQLAMNSNKIVGLLDPNPNDATYYLQSAVSVNYLINYINNLNPATLYSFSGFTFKNCGAAGRYGPTLQQMKTAYSATAWTQDLNNLSMASQGIQLWTVPETRLYTITCAGAMGGGYNDSYKAHMGIIMRNSFTLTKGSVIKILVGQAGTSYNSGSGGGGSFVVNSNNMPILIAGGGGGGFTSDTNLSTNSSGTTSTNGQDNTSGTNATAGKYGLGGQSTGNNPYSGGGGGFIGNGIDAINVKNMGGLSFMNGGNGGFCPVTATTVGGFGGGGGCNGSMPNDIPTGCGGGAGGGYSGGGAGDNQPGIEAGGGGSYDITNVYTSLGYSTYTNNPANTSGHGYVIIA